MNRTSVLASGGSYLQDGFQEICQFRGHKLQVRGINIVDVSEEKAANTTKSDVFISWDVHSIILWENGIAGSTPNVIKRYIFPKNQPQFISAIVYVPKMKVFLASALDMTFKVFDRNFKMLQSIHHEERAILSLEYDSERGIIICSGGSGITVWRFYRNLSIDAAHVIEKMFTFEGCDHWVSSMIYEGSTGRVYALMERSVHILSFRRRAVITTLKDIHDAPVTRVCWYGRSQFYLTGCSRGLIKCWTSHFRDANALQSSNTGNKQSANTEDDDDDGLVHSTKFALLHTFTGHNKAITGLVLHSTSGLAISASMCGLIRVLNLEAFNELFSVDLGTGITSLKGIRYGSHMACLFAQVSGTIRLWKVTSCCNFFASSAADVELLGCFENLQAEMEVSLTKSSQSIQKRIRFGESSAPDDESESSSGTDSDSKEDSMDQELGSRPTPNPPSRLTRQFTRRRNSTSFLGPNQLPASSIPTGVVRNTGTIISTAVRVQARRTRDGPAIGTKDKTARQAALQEKAIPALGRCVVSYASQDLRVYNGLGGLVCRVEPSEVVDGIKSYTVSVYQEMLFCLLESGMVKAYCTRSANSPLLKEIPMIRNSEGECGNVLCLVNLMPIGQTVVTQRNDRFNQRFDLRKQLVSPRINELVIVGTNTGTLLYLDTFAEMELVSMYQALHGPINQLKYRHTRRELFVMGTSYSTVSYYLKIFILPTMELKVETSGMQGISCFDLSPTLSIFGLGCVDGFVRLFMIEDNTNKCQELQKQGLTHDAAVVAMSFCDSLRIYVTSANDATVKLWNFDKQMIRSLKFNMPPCAVVFHGNVGDVLICQRSYLLTITREIWDEGGYMQKIRETVDPWQDLKQESEESENAMFRKFDLGERIREGVEKKFVKTSQIGEMMRGLNLEIPDLLLHNQRKAITETVNEEVENNGPTVVFDVRRPYSAVDKRPSIRFKLPGVDDCVQEQLEQEEHHVWSRPAHPSASTSPPTDSLDEVWKASVEPGDMVCEPEIEPESVYVARKVASLALSPRARIALLNSNQTASKLQMMSEINRSDNSGKRCSPLIELGLEQELEVTRDHPYARPWMVSKKFQERKKIYRQRQELRTPNERATEAKAEVERRYLESQQNQILHAVDPLQRISMLASSPLISVGPRNTRGPSMLTKPNNVDSEEGRLSTKQKFQAATKKVMKAKQLIDSISSNSIQPTEIKKESILSIDNEQTGIEKFQQELQDSFEMLVPSVTTTVDKEISFLHPEKPAVTISKRASRKPSRSIVVLNKKVDHI